MNLRRRSALLGALTSSLAAFGAFGRWTFAQTPSSFSYEVLDVGDEEDKKLIVALHPWGGGARGIAGVLARELSSMGRSATIVAPRGPLREGSGYAWVRSIVRESTPEELARAIRPVALMVARFAHEMSVRFSKPANLVGHSQGAIVALSAAALRPDSCVSCVVTSGLIPLPLLSEVSQVDDSPIIRAVHGADDAFVPVEDARRAMAHLERLGFDAELEVIERGGHRMNGALRQATVDHLRELFSS